MRKVLYVIRWPLALVVVLGVFPFMIVFSILLADLGPLAEWGEMTLDLLFSW